MSDAVSSRERAAEPRLCNACAHEIPLQARVCAACGRSQTRTGRFAQAVKWAAGIATFVSLLAGLNGLLGVHRNLTNRREAVRELTQAGDRLRADGDCRRAWELYARAAELDPTSPLVRRGREGVARDWLLDVRITGEERFSDVVDAVLPVLLTAYHRSKGPEKADYLALVGFSHYLEARDRPVDDVDVPSIYRAALEEDADNVLANTFLGHWLISERSDLVDGCPHLETAVSNADAEELPFVRSFQWSAFRNMARVAYTDDAEVARLDRERVKAAHSMLSRSEPLPRSTRHRNLAGEVWEAYVDDDFERFDATWGALEPAEHRRLVAVVADMLAAGRFDGERLRFERRLLAARMDEAEGLTERAVLALEELEAEIPVASRLRIPLDAALERLVGAPSESARLRDEPTAYHLDRLRTAPPGSQAFEDALDFVRGMTNRVSYHSAADVRLAIESMGAALEGIAAGAGPGSERPAGYLEVLRARAALQLASRALDGAIADFDEAARLAESEWDRASTLYDLACSYSLRSARRAPESDEQRVDRGRAVDALAAAIDAGYDDWTHLKQDGDLDPIRDVPRYAGLVAGR